MLLSHFDTRVPRAQRAATDLAMRGLQVHPADAGPGAAQPDESRSLADAECNAFPQGDGVRLSQWMRGLLAHLAHRSTCWDRLSAVRTTSLWAVGAVVQIISCSLGNQPR